MRLFLFSNRPVPKAAIVLVLLLIGGLIFYVAKEMRQVARLSGDMQEQRKQECADDNLPFRNAALSPGDRALDLLGRMTLEEKVGQMALVEKNSMKDPNDIAKFGLGGMLSGGGGNPADNTPAGWQEMVGGFEAYGQKSCWRIHFFTARTGCTGTAICRRPPSSRTPSPWGRPMMQTW
jgi:hypothetical protein